MGAYRYGFNGKEEDNEVKGEGNQQDYGMRIYDPRIGKFLSVDPITYQYPELTPYQFASNSPIQGVDFDGLELVNSNQEPRFLKIVGGRATLATLTATAVTKTAAKLGRRMAVNAAGELITTTGVSIGGSTIGAALMTVGLTILPMSMANPEGSKAYLDRQNEVLKKIKASHGQSHIEEFRDPSELSDEYLAGVEDRINQGTASGQDYLYAKEIAKRKKGNTFSFVAENNKNVSNEKVSFIQGAGSNARKIEVLLPSGFKKTKLKSHGQAVYSDGNLWITPDQDGHNGGIWKVYDSESDIGRGKSTRAGTYDKDLKKIAR